MSSAADKIVSRKSAYSIHSWSRGTRIFPISIYGFFSGPATKRGGDKDKKKDLYSLKILEKMLWQLSSRGGGG